MLKKDPQTGIKDSLYELEVHTTKVTVTRESVRDPGFQVRRFTHAEFTTWNHLIGSQELFFALFEAIEVFDRDSARN